MLHIIVEDIKLIKAVFYYQECYIDSFIYTYTYIVKWIMNKFCTNHWQLFNCPLTNDHDSDIPYVLYIVSCYKRTIALNSSLFFIAFSTCFMIWECNYYIKDNNSISWVVIGRHASNVFTEINVYSCGCGQEFNIKVSLD